MNVFGLMESYDYGEVHFKLDKATGLRAIVAIHDTRLGPALGGCRFLPYDTRGGGARRRAAPRARHDVQGRARGPAARRRQERPHPPETPHFDRVALFRAFGQFVDDLGGHYITAEDSGTGLEDMEVIRSVTKHVTGVDPSARRLGRSRRRSPRSACGAASRRA